MYSKRKMLIHLLIMSVCSTLYLIYIHKSKVKNTQEKRLSNKYHYVSQRSYRLPQFYGVYPRSPKYYPSQAYDFKGRNLKKIFILAPPRKRPQFGNGQAIFKDSRCKVNTCFTTSDHNMFKPEELDAVLWVNNKEGVNEHYNRFPNGRSNHTRYVFYEHEPAAHQLKNENMKTRYKGIFNWTITYSEESDIYRPYVRIYRKNYKAKKRNANYAFSKTKFVAWMVSNCNSSGKREQYVDMLKQYIDIDVYGKCGSIPCARSNNFRCRAMIGKQYKFYLAFENSLCYDYMTEKFITMAAYKIVPVVYGRGPYWKHAPPHSYIDIMDFPSPKSLAEYLQYLDNNDTAYSEYLQWHDDHMIFYWTTQVALCDLCEKLHTDHEVKTIPDILQWFVKGCIIENNILDIMNKYWHVPVTDIPEIKHEPLLIH